MFDSLILNAEMTAVCFPCKLMGKIKRIVSSASVGVVQSAPDMQSAAVL